MSGSPDHTIKLYERYAREWDAQRNSVVWNEERWYDRFVSLLEGNATVLDLGCGSGIPVAQYLVKHKIHVTGVDASPTMISLCRERFTEQEWIVSDMRHVSLAKKFSGILGWDSYFFLDWDSQRRMFDVFAAHAGPSCVLMFNTGPRHTEAIGEYRGEPLYHASLDAQEYQHLLDCAGFDVVDHAVEDRSAGLRTIWLAKHRS